LKQIKKELEEFHYQLKPKIYYHEFDSKTRDKIIFKNEKSIYINNNTKYFEELILRKYNILRLLLIVSLCLYICLV